MKKRGILFCILILLIVFISGCGEERDGVKEEDIIKDEKTNGGYEKMAKGKILMIIAQNNFRDEELTQPKEIFENSGYEVDVASITTDTAKGMLGLEVKPDLAVKDANIDEYEYVVVVGGSGSPELMNYDEVLNAVKKAKNVGSLCLGPMVLAKAGVLQGKKATVFETPESRSVLESNGAEFVKEDIVVDGTTVTANGPKAAKRFANKIMEVLEK